KRIGRQADPARSHLRIETLPFYVFACGPHGSEFAQVPLSQDGLCKLRGPAGAPARAKTATVDVGRRSSLTPLAQPIDEFIHVRHDKRQPLFHRFSADLEGVAQVSKIDVRLTS